MKPEAEYRKNLFSTSQEGEIFGLWSGESMDEGKALADMEIRAHLCAALADMSESMRSLLGLMARHNFITVLPDKSFPAYEHVMERIGTAASQAGHVVERSRALDRSIALAHLPSAALPKQ